MVKAKIPAEKKRCISEVIIQWRVQTVSVGRVVLQSVLSRLELVSTNDVAVFRSRDGTLSDKGGQ